MLILPKSYYTIKKSKKKGRGVFATHDIEPKTVIGDYIGTIVRPDSSDENKNGLYDMRGGLKYDFLANPKKEGIHWINHSCANNCEAYPYQGHILYAALRKIFKGEEITANYGLGTADEKDIVCSRHACHCGTKICTGSMHEDESHYYEWFDAWENLIKKNFGKWYRALPGRYGTELQPLAHYPLFVPMDDDKVYTSIFGAEMKSPSIYKDASLPSIVELQKRISETGRMLSFPKIHFIVYGIRNEIILGERK
jgi:hypothetical protein